MWYRLEGHEPVPCTIETIEGALEGDRRVAFDTVGDSEISTVFLALDHGFGFGPRLLFETMVFGGPLDQKQRRYSTWEQAEAGHAEVLAEVRAKAENSVDRMPKNSGGGLSTGDVQAYQ